MNLENLLRLKRRQRREFALRTEIRWLRRLREFASTMGRRKPAETMQWLQRKRLP